MWWWDGAQWRPAISPDGRWRWDGRTWVPAGPTAGPGGGGGGMAVLITLLAFGGVLVFVSFFVLVVLLTMGEQIKNVFSNVVAALGS
jgi:hypothetical protein